MVDIRGAQAERVKGYLAKYLAKDPETLPDGMHRYGSSGGIKMEVYPNGEGRWRVETYIEKWDAWFTTLNPALAIMAVLGRSGNDCPPP